MCVAVDLEPHDMLESFHQSFISQSEVMQALNRRYVSNYDCDSFVFLESKKFVFKPFHDASWVRSVFEQPPVHLVTGLSVDRNDLAVGKAEGF